MELEQLKSIWQKTTEREVEGFFISREEVRDLIKKRSNSAVAQIKRGVRNKVFMAGAIGLVMVIFSILIFSSEEAIFPYIDFLSDPETNIEVGIFYLVFGLVILFISFFNAYSYRQILNIEDRESDLKTSVQSILGIIRRAVKAKVYSDSLVIPFTVLILAVVSLTRGQGIFPSTTILLLSVLGAVGFGIFSYFLTRHGQNKRYGRQIKDLEECLKELQE